VERFLTEHAGIAPAAAKRRAAQANGAIGEALAMAENSADARTAAALLAAARTGGAARWRYVLGVKPFLARGAFTDTLDATLGALHDELERRLRGGEGGEGARSEGRDVPAEALVSAIRDVQQARRLAQGNVNPQLITADLLRRLAESGV
jgi:hypothetical protein